ncbi:MAG: FAD-dependent oxidoreductase [Candidatus Scalindua sp. AMX11]|nr:MAG: FAD-dependent oxidoreductase [Candidatus Scalindua sp.]NOG86008.1 FAD-dependent oxidoreductase [Planctomycetota bacterium]RZV91363.1 MAG: FAD-dependent oxidoreductase [Candidatus Scalindua sp. SCAELEC01]TDE65920.1 MAG: FAD-dependent oxidoreductase [Candidatus Scalindua sp. AMX11]GJQ59223.1 MAG: NADH oxidase [Candidatus Scalindua sp.]
MSELFEPINLGSIKVKNRLAMSAMDLGFTSDGSVNERFIDFYVERARGGVGLIVIGGCYPEMNGKVWKSIIGLDKDDFIPGLKKFADTMHKYDVKVAAQLLHGGRSASSFFTKMRPVSASSLAHVNIKQAPHALTIPEIKRVIKGFVDATMRLKKAGFDAVEIHGGMGYLINQFLTRATNERRDRYGGSLKNRINFAREIVIAIKDKIGKNFPIIFRLSGDDFVDNGLKIDESIEIAKELEKAGVDAFNISPGWHESRTPIMLMSIPRMSYIFLAEKMKDQLQVPVIGSVRVNDLALAEEILDNGQSDMVSIGRPLIVDPELPKKYKKKQFEDIRRCIACNQGCFDSLLNFKSVSCIYNVRAGRERELKIRKAKKMKRVMVIGGGPGGLEAARVAALRGHEVHLYEKNSVLGGQLRYAYLPPGRGEIENVITFLEAQIKKLNVKIQLHKKVDTKEIKNLKPDAVIAAIGGSPIIPPIPGIREKNVVVAEDIFDNRVKIGKDVVIIGGGTIGCEVALHIAKMGAMNPEVACYLLRNGVISGDEAVAYTSRGKRNITILEMKNKIGGAFGISTRWVIIKQVKDAGVECMNGLHVKEIKTSKNGKRSSKAKSQDTKICVTFEKEEKVNSIYADTVVIAVGYKPNQDLLRKLDGTVDEFYTIGDCVTVRTALEAIHEGFEAGLKV